jgi:hypothetical protein
VGRGGGVGEEAEGAVASGEAAGASEGWGEVAVGVLVGVGGEAAAAGEGWGVAAGAGGGVEGSAGASPRKESPPTP